MFSSLQLIKSFPLETKIYCGHEYTLKNSEFCVKMIKKILLLKKKLRSIKKINKNGLPTIPSTIKEEELECNIFLRSKDVEIIFKIERFKG